MYIPVRTVDPGYLEIWLQLLAVIDIKPGPGGSSMTDDTSTRAILDRTAVQHFVPLPWQWITVVALYPSSQIVAHRDPPAAGTVRYHIPLQTNDDCWCFHGGVWQQLPVGQIYSMNPREQHGAVNWGSEVRLHLMVDRVEEAQ